MCYATAQSKKISQLEEVFDSLKTLNFNYYLMPDRISDIIFELKEGRKVEVINVRAISDNDILKRYPPGHKQVDKLPWE